MPEVELVARYRYSIPDDLEKRRRSYGEEDLELCKALDIEGGIEALMYAAEQGQVRWSIEEMDRG